MHQSVALALPGFLKQFEGKVNFMYLDVKGLVTIGVGHLIDPVDQALKLDFQTKGGGGASTGEIAAEWSTVKARKDLIGQGSAAFGQITRLQLTDRGISQMIDQHAAAIESYIKTNASARIYFSNFDRWPADAQLGFMGIAWGIVPIPQFGWHAFPKACQAEDWLTAAKECKISSPLAAGRNEAHKLMFMNAAAVKANGENIAELSWPIRRGTSANP
jgi:hypothetical protein